MTSISSSSLGSSLVSGIELVAFVLVAVVILGAVGVFVVLIVANRAEPDPTSRRSLTVYLFGVSFIAIWTALIGSSALVGSLVQLIGGHPGVSNSNLDNSTAQQAVLGAIIAFISVAVIVVHLRRGVALATDGNPPSPLARRVGESYVSAVAFVSVLVGAVALGVVIYSICQVAGPGVFGAAGRMPALRHLLDAIYVAAAAGVLIGTHLRLAVSPIRRNSAEAG